MPNEMILLRDGAAARRLRRDMLAQSVIVVTRYARR